MIDPTVWESINPVFSGETAICDGSSYFSTPCEYYLFPIWWRTNKAGRKQYKTYLFDWRNSPSATKWSPDFGTALDGDGNRNPDVPFPDLGFSMSPIDLDNLDCATLDGFTFDTGTFDNAYDIAGLDDLSTPDLSEIRSMVSRGIKIKFTYNANHHNGLGIMLGTLNADGKQSYCTSIPRWNADEWGSNYFDVSLDHLFYALAGTNNVPMGGNRFYIKDTPAASWVTFDSNMVKIVGFNSAPTGKADASRRDYADVLFLLMPVNVGQNQLEWGHQFNALPEPLEWTIAAEDLGGSFDWDFNDAVFRFTDVIHNLNSINKNNTFALFDGPQDAATVRIITVTPLAAGGTMPIYITYYGADVCRMPDMLSGGEVMYSTANNSILQALDTRKSGAFIVGRELHKWLGASSHERPVNAGATRDVNAGTPVQFAIPFNYDPTSYLIYPAAASGNNSPLYGFTVLVDKENTLDIDAINDTERGLRHLPEHVLGHGTYQIGAPSDNEELPAPQMIMVTEDWQWPREGVRISEPYPGFKEWLADPSTTPSWHTTPADPAKVTKRLLKNNLRGQMRSSTVATRSRTAVL